MKKTDQEILEQIREYVRLNPDDTYKEIAASFDVSEITIKRHCSGLRRSGSRPNDPNPSGDLKRLWSNVKKVEGQCWEWLGCHNPDGYGFMHCKGKSTPVHQLVYESMKGAVPDGLELDHLCRNRGCCNPDHLEPVTHAENMARAGIIPRTAPSGVDTSASCIDTAASIDTDVLASRTLANKGVIPLLNEPGIKGIASDTSTALIPVSMADPGRGRVGSNTAPRIVVTPLPQRSDPYAPLCNMTEPPALAPPIPPTHEHEGPSGTKQDLGIDDWAQTEFGLYWAQEVDGVPRNIRAETEEMRETGEPLYWYRVLPYCAEETQKFMSARTGPEACVKVERTCGKGWAQSWEYLQPDPSHSPFAQFYLKVLYKGHLDSIGIIARTAQDSIAMVDTVWGAGYVMNCQKPGVIPDDGVLSYWIKVGWRQAVSVLRTRIEERINNKNRG
jgi:hypothetical protein